MRERGSGLLLAAALAFALSGAAACGDDDDAKQTTTETPPGQHRDAGSGTDTFDADVPLPRKDAGASNVLPGAPEEGLAGNCSADSNKIFTIAERDQPFLSMPLAVDPATSDFALPYIGTGRCLDAVHWASMAGAASAGEPHSQVAVDACAFVRDAVASSAGGKWLVADIDNREAPYDVWVEAYGGTPAQAGRRISQNSHVETALALTTLRDDSTLMLAYADEDPNAGQGLYVRPLSAAGEPLSDAVTIEQSSTLYYANLAIEPLGKSGAALVYVRYSLDYATSDIVFVALDGQGTMLREPWVLARHAGPSASVDVALDSDGGGIVYARAESTIGRQVWFQQIGSDGQAALERDGKMRAPAQRIVNAPARGSDVAMTKLQTGFIVTYRALPSDSESRAKVRVYFLDRYGAIIGSSDVSYTSSAGGRTGVQSANDGRAVVSWNEVADDGRSSLKVARLPCLGN